MKATGSKERKKGSQKTPETLIKTYSDGLHLSGAFIDVKCGLSHGL